VGTIGFVKIGMETGEEEGLEGGREGGRCEWTDVEVIGI